MWRNVFGVGILIAILFSLYLQAEKVGWPLAIISVPAFAVVLLLFSWTRLAKNEHTKTWYCTNAKVNKSYIHEASEVVSAGAMMPYYYPRIEYSYLIDGVRYESDVVAHDTKSVRSKEKALTQRLLSELIVNDEVKVYVNSKNKCQSVIIPALSKDRRSHYLAIGGAGLVILIISFIMLFSLD